MFNLKTIALKLFRAASTQVLTSISIITVSICLIMTMSVYIWNAKAQMEEEIYALFGAAEMTVGYNPEQQTWVTDEQLTAISQIAGVTEVSPVHLTHTNVEGVMPFVYTVGVENDALVKSRYHYEGDLTTSDVVVSQKIATLFKKEVGDTLNIEFTPYTIKEILTPLPGASDVQVVILHNDTVNQWLPEDAQDAAGVFTLIDLHESAYPSFVTEQLIELDKELRIDITNEYDFVKANFQALSIFIIVLSFFVLIITCVLLISTFQLVFYQLKEQLMVLRALGATKKQVGKIVQVQLMTIISTGVVFGTLLSLVVIKSWLPQLIEKMQLPEARTEFPIWLAISIAVAIFVILQGIMQWQVQKSMRLLPLQIATENHETLLTFTKKKLYAISIVFVIALLCFLTAFVEGNSGKSALLILTGSLLSCMLLLYVIPFIFSSLLKFALQPVRMIFGKEAYLACQQLMPQVRKNMPIVLSIIGLMVILIFGTTLFKSVQETEKDYIKYLFESPVVVHNDLNNPTLTVDVIEEIDALPSVNYAYARSNYTHLDFFINGQWQGETFRAIDIEKFVEVGKIDAVSGAVSNGVVISSEFAKQHNLQIGDSLRTGRFNFETQSVVELQPMQIIGFSETEFSNLHISVDWISEIAQVSEILIDEIMVETSNIEQALIELQFLHERWPALTFTDFETFTEENNQMYYQRWSLFVGVLVILIAATCLGVIQTLLHTIYGKRADYAIQRLIGLSPNGLIKLILTQVLSFVIYGLTIGTFIGVCFTLLLSLIDSGSTIVFNYIILVSVSGVFLVITLAIFTLQGYLISRKVLANELTE